MPYKNVISICLLLLSSFVVAAQTVSLSPEVKALETKVYQFNNAFRYDSSLRVLKQFIDRKTSQNTDKYYGYLFVSYTYKRLFDYAKTLANLDSALVYGSKTPQAAFCKANINCQKAYALFDTRAYEEASVLMNDLAKTNYAHLDLEQKAKINMQEAYLQYLAKDYPTAERKYQDALANLLKGSPCDVPMIYAKQIQLYGAMKNEKGIRNALKLSLQAADTCHIAKYRLYTYQMLYQTYEKQGDFRGAYEALKISDSLNSRYDNLEHLGNLKVLEEKYERTKIENQARLYQAELKTQKGKNALFLALFIGALLAFVVYYLFQNQQKLKQESANQLNFTKQLLENIEDERKRIASDLHDSISHELLVLKSPSFQNSDRFNGKIDHIINDIRIISRNLHPVMFDTTGLRFNIEALVERVQHQHNFLVTTDIDYQNSLPVSTELQLYRIIQEALTNVIKYADAHAAKISIVERNGVVAVEIKDNGKGFEVEKMLNNGKAFGLHNIVARSRAIGGEAKITSSAAGTDINLNVPTPKL